jgi:hypothetical protein
LGTAENKGKKLQHGNRKRDIDILAKSLILLEYTMAIELAKSGYASRARAKARGVQFGRPPTLTAHQRQEALQRLAEGAAQADVARSYNVSQARISSLASG